MDRVFVFIIGSMIGSFLNVCIYRLPRGKSVIFPPSYCPKCGKNIYWNDNIPILSYLMLAGRCRFCIRGIPLRYPLVEMLTAVLILLLYTVFGMSPKFFAYSILTCELIVASFIDLDTSMIPDAIPVTGLAAGWTAAFIFPSVFGAVSKLGGVTASLEGTVLGAASVWMIGSAGKFLFRKKLKEIGETQAMGEADIYLLAMIGSFLGWKMVLFTFFVAPFFGMVMGIFAMIKENKHIIPYGPYLSLAALAAIFFGDKILGLLFCGLS